MPCWARDAFCVRPGRAAEALDRLRRAPADRPLLSEVRLLTAEAAYNTGDRELSITAWREHLNSGPEALDRSGVALRSPAALLERARQRRRHQRGFRRSRQDRAHARCRGPARADRGAAFGAPCGSREYGRVNSARTRGRARAPRAVGAAGCRARPARPPQARKRSSCASERWSRRGATPKRRRRPRPSREIPKAQRWSAVGCEAGVLRAKASAGLREWGRAADLLDDVIRSCTSDRELWARALYLAGTYAASDRRHAQAILRFEQLEKELPKHTLADDCRLEAAISHYEMGSEARFTELLSTMPDDFPEGDMMLDGVFRLAVRRIEKGDWSGAASVLDRAAGLASAATAFAGRSFPVASATSARAPGCRPGKRIAVSPSSKRSCASFRFPTTCCMRIRGSSKSIRSARDARVTKR